MKVLLFAVVIASATLLADAFVPMRSAAQCKAASMRPDGTIDGCISQFGDVRSSCGAPCRRGEEPFSWKQQGPPGDDGVVADANLECLPGEYMVGFTVASGVAQITCAVPPTPTPTASPTASPTTSPTPGPTASPKCSCAEISVSPPNKCFDMILEDDVDDPTKTMTGYFLTNGTARNGVTSQERVSFTDFEDFTICFNNVNVGETIFITDRETFEGGNGQFNVYDTHIAVPWNAPSLRIRDVAGTGFEFFSQWSFRGVDELAVTLLSDPSENTVFRSAFTQASRLMPPNMFTYNLELIITSGYVPPHGPCNCTEAGYPKSDGTTCYDVVGSLGPGVETSTGYFVASSTFVNQNISAFDDIVMCVSGSPRMDSRGSVLDDNVSFSSSAKAWSIVDNNVEANYDGSGFVTHSIESSQYGHAASTTAGLDMRFSINSFGYSNFVRFQDLDNFNIEAITVRRVDTEKPGTKSYIVASAV